MSTSAKITLRKKLLKNKKFPIFLRITINRKSKYYSTPFSSTEADWDHKLCQFKKKVAGSLQLNSALNKILQDAFHVISILENEYRNYNLILFDKIFLREENCNLGFNDLFETEIQKMFQNDQINYAKSMRETLIALSQFEPKLSEYRFENIDFQFLTKFEIFLRQRGANDGGISAYMRNIRKIYNLGINLKIVKSDRYPFNDYKLSKFKKKDVSKALTESEFQQFIDFDINLLPAAKNAWYSYIFSYYARGMNFTDLAELKWSDVENNKFSYNRNKTDALLKINLPDLPIFQELKRYFSVYRPYPTPYIFPILTKEISNYSALELVERKNNVRRYYNKQLKQILKKLEIEKNITFYTARHTFATTALRNNININVIKQSLGHKKLSTTENYLEDFKESEVDEIIMKIF